MTSRKHRWLVVPGGAAVLSLLASACGGGSSSSSPSSTAAAASGATMATVASAKDSELGSSILVDGQGRTLYLFEKDGPNSSSCSGSCAQAWPPLTASGAPQAGPGVTATLLSTISGPGGQRQVTYSGHPLYYYASDTKAGQTNGEGLNQFGADWYAVSPHGTKVEKEGS